MKFLQSFNKKLGVFLLGACIWFNAGHAGNNMPGTGRVAVSGTAVIAAWHTFDSITGNYFIQATSSITGFALTPLTTTAQDAYSPHLAAANSSTGTLAVAAWLANQSGSLVIQVATLNNSGTWTLSPTPLTAGTAIEFPRNDYKVDISSDGNTITVFWSAFLTTTNDYRYRSAISTNGGASWNTQSIGQANQFISSFD